MSERQNRLLEVILNSGKSLKQISEELEIPYQTLANYSRGKRRPRHADTWDKLANYFGVSTAFLMGADETAKEELNLDEIAALLQSHLNKVLNNEARTEKENRTLLSATSISQLIVLNKLFESSIFDVESKTYCLLYLANIITKLLDLSHTLIEYKTFQSIHHPISAMEKDAKLNDRTLMGVGAVTTSINRYINHLNELTPFDFFSPEKAEELLMADDVDKEIENIEKDIYKKIKDAEKELSEKIKNFEQQFEQQEE